ncbi:MAG: hypothetical protein NC819_04445 [Candidatus Omnitrophica bacterium]|nr:hypothetical protein [Candidatus Omnitrophota bacterium]
MPVRCLPTGEKGIALLTTIIILLTLGALGAALNGLVNSRVLSATLEVDRLQAAYLAEAGLAQAVHELVNGRDLYGKDGIGFIPPTALGPGFFSVEHDSQSRSLIGVGVVGDVRRVIVSRYD